MTLTLTIPCPACTDQRLHTPEDWAHHPYAGHGYTGTAWTHPDLPETNRTPIETNWAPIETNQIVSAIPNVSLQVLGGASNVVEKCAISGAATSRPISGEAVAKAAPTGGDV